MIQLQFLNKILITQDASLLTENNLTADFFSDYPQEFSFIKEHIDKYDKVPDSVTFGNNFPEFTFIEVSESPKYLLNALYEDRKTRRLAKTFNEVKRLVTEGKIDDALKLFTTSANDISQDQNFTCIDLFKDLNRYDRYVERIDNFNKYYISTGFPELDERIGGWDRQEELATIVARPGIGKSWLLLKCAIAAAQQGLNVGIYSGEMSENKVGTRIDTLIGHIPNSKIMRGDASIQLQYQEYIKKLPTMFKGSLKVITPAMIGGPAGVTALRSFIEREHLDILCIDQHSLMEDDRKGKTAIEKASNISKDLKNLQVLKHIPIIAVSQQNRAEAIEGNLTANVSQSDRIAQDSTVILFLEQKDDILTITVGKCRDNASGIKLKYSIDLNRGIFEFLPDGADPLNNDQCNSLKNEFDGGDEF